MDRDELTTEQDAQLEALIALAAAKLAACMAEIQSLAAAPEHAAYAELVPAYLVSMLEEEANSIRDESDC
jgi:hypothetical protein